MSKFNNGMRVVVIDEHNRVRKGVIVNVHDILEIAIVKFDDEHVEKVHFSCLGIEPESREEPKKASKPVEKSEITITPDEFKKIASRVVAEEAKKLGKDGIMFGLALTIVTAKIHGALFFDEGDND